MTSPHGWDQEDEESYGGGHSERKDEGHNRANERTHTLRAMRSPASYNLFLLPIKATDKARSGKYYGKTGSWSERQS
jgi:hypothetical protein